MSIRIVLAEHRQLWLDALEALLRQAVGFEVVACCRTGEEALDEVRRLAPDVLVADAALPEAGGLAVLRQLAYGRAGFAMVLVAEQIAERDALAVLRLGAGLVLQEMPGGSLIRCIRAVHAGEPWIERRSSAHLLRNLVERERAARQVSGTLTSRELEVVRLVGKGLRNRAIAEDLGIRESTVKVHLGNIFEKLGVQGRLELYHRATERGLI